MPLRRRLPVDALPPRALWRLNEVGLLTRVSRVSSVSGGSITAAALAVHWRAFSVDPAGRWPDVVAAVRGVAGHTIDVWAVLVGLLPFATVSGRVAAAYDKFLCRGKTLQDLPDEGTAAGQGPMFVFNSTSVQTGVLWRFSKQYMGDYKVGLIRNPGLSLAKAVAASSAFPPVLSPATLRVNPDDFDPATRGPLFKDPYNRRVLMTDGGVYDNLGLETAFKRYRTLLVSDGGQKADDVPRPHADWVRQGLRVVGLIQNQVGSLRKRQLIDAYERTGQDCRTGTYWGIGSHFADYQVSDPLGAGRVDSAALAAIGTRLAALSDTLQERLINWGYAICDAGLRKHFGPALQAQYNVKITDPPGVPYPNVWP